MSSAAERSTGAVGRRGDRAGRPRRAGRCLLLGLALVATSCSAGGTEGSSTPTSTTTAASSTTRAADQEANAEDPSTGTPTTDGPVPDIEPIDWEDCGGDTLCATIEAPLDYDDPDGPTIELAVNRRPVDDPDDRLGAIFVNPGGPGASAVDFARGLPLPRDLGKHFDLVAVDPRGVGGSTPLVCDAHLLDIYDADPTMEDQADTRRYLEVSQEYVDDCTEAAGDLLPHLGTEDLARDMDLVRAAMGDEQLDYLGFSYGTAIGQAYAKLFPTHVRSMVLDGPMDLSVDGLTAAATQAAGFETALAAYIEDCDERECLGPSARKVIDEVTAKAEANPIPGGDRPAGPGVLNLAMGQAMYSQSLWPQLTDALGDAYNGDGADLVDLADQYLRRDDDGTFEQGFEIYFATGCLDLDYPRDPEAVLAAAKEAGKDSPTFGEAITNDYLRCAQWPVPSMPLTPVPPDTEGLPPILVISTTRDPATPYENGVRVADQLPGGILITNDDDGHTAFTTGKPCILEPVVAYVLDPEDAPTEDLTCT